MAFRPARLPLAWRSARAFRVALSLGFEAVFALLFPAPKNRVFQTLERPAKGIHGVPPAASAEMPFVSTFNFGPPSTPLAEYAPPTRLTPGTGGQRRQGSASETTSPHRCPGPTPAPARGTPVNSSEATSSSSGSSPLSSQHQIPRQFKTEFCLHRGACRHGERCRFAHTAEELRPR